MLNSLLDEESEIGDWVHYKFTFTRSDKVACEAVSELSWLAAYEAMFLDPVGVRPGQYSGFLQFMSREGRPFSY